MTNEFGKDLMDRSGIAEPDRSLAPEHKQDTNECLISKDSRGFDAAKFERRHDTGHSDPTIDRYSVLPSTVVYTHAQKKRPTKGTQRLPTSGNQSDGMPSLRSSRSTTSLKYHVKDGTSASTADSRGMTTENYCKVYQQRQRTRERLAQARKTMHSCDSTLITRNQKEEETNLRVQARFLSDQIRWWQGQFGHNDHEPHYISGMISSLEQQLNAIDARYWP